MKCGIGSGGGKGWTGTEMTKPCLYPAITCGLEKVLRQGHIHHSGGSTQGGSVSWQFQEGLPEERGWELGLDEWKNFNKHTWGVQKQETIPGGEKNNSNGTEVGESR